MIAESTLNLSEKRTQLIIWTLLFVMPIVGMAVDLIAPSLPAIASGLQISTATARDVITLYLLGYAIGNFVTGFLTDALGRQKLIRIGLFSFVIVSLIPVFFPNITMLLLARFLQGITIGGVAVLTRSIFSDVLSPEKLIRLGPLMGTMWGLGPVLGPIIGGYLQYYFGWQAGFCFFALIAFILFLAAFFIVPETHFKLQPLNIKMIKNNLVEVISHRLFMAIVGLMGLAYSLIIAFNALGPFLIQEVMHYSPVFFGHIALYIGLVFLAATFICRYLLRRYSVEKIYFAVINLFFLIAALAVLASYFFRDSIVLVTVISALMFVACGFIYPLSIGKGMSLFRHIAGTASATIYLFNILLTSLTAFVASFINIQSAIPMMWMYCLLLLICVFIYWGLIRKES